VLSYASFYVSGDSCVMITQDSNRAQNVNVVTHKRKRGRLPLNKRTGPRLTAANHNESAATLWYCIGWLYASKKF
jgi:hypothetical protein